MKNFGRFLSIFLPLFLALSTWLIFYPGILSFDSTYIYWEAATGQFDDIHSPLLAIILHIILKAGGGIGLLVLAQCLAGFYGIEQFAIELARNFDAKEDLANNIAVFMLFILSSLVTPMAVFFTTFWTDT